MWNHVQKAILALEGLDDGEKKILMSLPSQAQVLILKLARICQAGSLRGAILIGPIRRWRVRRIGMKLCALGLMQCAFQVVVRVARSSANDLDHVWDGIGGWMS
jgi:hypothetical protein